MAVEEGSGEALFVGFIHLYCALGSSCLYIAGFTFISWEFPDKEKKVDWLTPPFPLGNLPHRMFKAYRRLV